MNHFIRISIQSAFTICTILLSVSEVMIAQVDIVGSDKLIMSIGGHTLKIPYFANYSLDKKNNNISHAIVVLHGVDRNAEEYYNNIIAGTFMRPSFSDSTIIVSPQFLTEEDIVFHKLDNQHLYWTEGGWTSGSNSRNENSNPRPARIPSLAVLDTVMIRIIAACPNLRSLVFAGHSAGGQVVNRYAASSPFSDILCEKNKISTKFIVANPSSYLYMDNKRAIAGKTDQFEIPSGSCIAYNEWKFGLDNLFTYPATMGRENIRKFLGKRQVAYLLGELDNNPNSSTLDNTCEAKLQGRHRLERGIIYFNHLQQFYGQDILKTQTLDIIPNTGHDNFKMFTSAKGLFHLFESRPDMCKTLSSAAEYSVSEKSFKVSPNPSSGLIYLILPESGGELHIYSVHGNHIAGYQDISDIEINFDTGSWAPGAYIFSYQKGKEILKRLFVKL